MLTVDEVAALLRVCRATAYRMVKDGKILSLRAGNGIRIPRASLARHLTS